MKLHVLAKSTCYKLPLIIVTQLQVEPTEIYEVLRNQGIVNVVYDQASF